MIYHPEFDRCIVHVPGWDGAAQFRFVGMNEDGSYVIRTPKTQRVFTVRQDITIKRKRRECKPGQRNHWLLRYSFIPTAGRHGGATTAAPQKKAERATNQPPRSIWPVRDSDPEQRIALPSDARIMPLHDTRREARVSNAVCLSGC
jgi:hypothetical protein